MKVRPALSVNSPRIPIFIVNIYSKHRMPRLVGQRREANMKIKVSQSMMVQTPVTEEDKEVASTLLPQEGEIIHPELSQAKN